MRWCTGEPRSPSSRVGSGARSLWAAKPGPARSAPALKANREEIRASGRPNRVSVASVATVSNPEQVTRVPPTFNESMRIDARTPESPLPPMFEQTSQRLLRERIIFLGQQVDDEIANRIVGELLLLSAEDRHKDITLYINSPGGSVYAGMAIYDVMQYIPNDVRTVGMGMAASMGQMLLCAGAPGKRYALPHTRVMMHQPSGGIGGTASDIRILADQLLYIKKMFLERISLHTGQTQEQIEKDADRDRWFTAQEAKEYGFIDEVLEGTLDVTGTTQSR